MSNQDQSSEVPYLQKIHLYYIFDNVSLFLYHQYCKLVRISSIGVQTRKLSQCSIFGPAINIVVEYEIANNSLQCMHKHKNIQNDCRMIKLKVIRGILYIILKIKRVAAIWCKYFVFCSTVIFQTGMVCSSLNNQYYYL